MAAAYRVWSVVMNGRTSTILTALIVAALVAVGVAYLIANPTEREKEAEPQPVVTDAPLALDLPEVNNEGSAGDVNGETSSPLPALVMDGKGAVENTAQEVDTSAPTGAAEWVVAGLVGMVGIGGWNLVRLQRAS